LVSAMLQQTSNGWWRPSCGNYLRSRKTGMVSSLSGRRTFQKQPGNQRKVFQRFRGARLQLNLEKCQLFQNEVQYLGHITRPEGVTRDSEKLQAAEHWPLQRDKHKLRSFLGSYQQETHCCICWHRQAADPTHRREEDLPVVPRSRFCFPIPESRCVRHPS
jgi:hypothetical protein